MNKFIFLILFFFSATFSEETYRDLCNELKNHFFFQQNFSKQGYFYYPDSLNELQEIPFIIENTNHLDFITFLDNDTISINQNETFLKINSKYNYNHEGELSLITFADNILFLFHKDNWDSIIDQSEFFFQTINDSLSQLNMVHIMDSTKSIIIEYNENNYQVTSITSNIQNKIEFYIKFSLDSQFDHIQPKKTNEKIFLRVFPNLKTNLSQNLKLPDFLQSSYIANRIFLTGTENSNHLIYQYISGFSVFYISFSPKEKQVNIKKQESSKYLSISNLYPIYQVQTKNSFYQLCGNLTETGIQSISKQLSKATGQNTNHGEWKFTPIRIALFIILSMALIFVFLKTGRLRKR